MESIYADIAARTIGKDTFITTFLLFLNTKNSEDNTKTILFFNPNSCRIIAIFKAVIWRKDFGRNGLHAVTSFDLVQKSVGTSAFQTHRENTRMPEAHSVPSLENE